MPPWTLQRVLSLLVAVTMNCIVISYDMVSAKSAQALCHSRAGPAGLVLSQQRATVCARIRPLAFFHNSISRTDDAHTAIFGCPADRCCFHPSPPWSALEGNLEPCAPQPWAPCDPGGLGSYLAGCYHRYCGLAGQPGKMGCTTCR